MATFKDLNLLSVGNTIQIAGAIWIGEGKAYLCMFPGEDGVIGDGVSEVRPAVFMPTDGSDSLKVEVLSMTTDEWEQFIRQTDIMEAEVLAEGPDGITKSIIRKSARQIAQDISWKVYLRDNFKCRYCGRGPGIPLTVDHLVLWEEGGPSTEANLLSACKKCNKTRGNTQYADWLRSPYYRKVSQGLSALVRKDNQDLVPTLDAIPRMLHKPTKRK